MPAQTTKFMKVTKEFTDAAGKRWKIGDTFTGSAEQIAAAKQAGQIQEAPATDQPEAE